MSHHRLDFTINDATFIKVHNSKELCRPKHLLNIPAVLNFSLKLPVLLQGKTSLAMATDERIATCC